MAIGNGCTNWTFDTMPATLNMTYGHALFNTELWDKMSKEFCDYSGIEFDQNPSAACMGYLDEFDTLIEGIDLYQIYLSAYANEFELCTAEENAKTRLAMGKGLEETVPRRPYYPYSMTGDYTPWFNRHLKSKNGGKGYCLTGDPLTAYLSNSAVKEALHIAPQVAAWEGCSNINYTVLQKGSEWIWRKLKGVIRMLKYSGDKDGVVPTDGSLRWINGLGWNETTPWSAYMDANKQVGGYYWQLDGMDFGTVHGAGHMCPADEPQRSEHLIMGWIHGDAILPVNAT